MKKNNRYFIWLSGAIILILGCCFQILIGLLTEAEKSNTLVSESYAVYKFDPETILDSLNVKEDVFTKIEGEQGEILYDESDPYATTFPTVRWLQEDYIAIANEAALQFTGKSLTTWELNFLLFRMSCREAESGPQSVNLTLFIHGPEVGERSRLDIDIYPRSGQLYLRKAFYSPHTLSEGMVPFENLLISFEEVFTIAEEHGGYEARQSINNNCLIRVSYVASKDDYWNVNYTQNSDNLRIFEIWIDETTGEFKIITSP